MEPYGSSPYQGGRRNKASVVKPVIDGITPALGHVGTLVTITGKGFGAKQGASFVSVNGAKLAPLVIGDILPSPAHLDAQNKARQTNAQAMAEREATIDRNRITERERAITRGEYPRGDSSTIPGGYQRGGEPSIAPTTPPTPTEFVARPVDTSTPSVPSSNSANVSTATDPPTTASSSSSPAPLVDHAAVKMVAEAWSDTRIVFAVPGDTPIAQKASGHSNFIPSADIRVTVVDEFGDEFESNVHTFRAIATL
jgi:hypothetical protein